MKKLIVFSLLAVLLCLTLLVGCQTTENPPEATKGESTDAATQGCAHDWQDATCNAPKTCSLCQATEGEALAHSWQDATCDAPKTCSLCQATEGEALSHDMAPANHQAPSTCTLCGHTEGEALTAFYEDKKVNVIHVEAGKEYDYKTACYTNNQKTTVGKLTWSEHEVFASKEGYPAKEGYEWHTINLTIRYSDKNAQKYGFQVAPGVDNYYTGDTTGFTDDGSAPFKILWNGEEHECLMIADKDAVSDWENNTCTYTRPYAWRVPVGFDGIVILFLHTGYTDGDIYTMTDPAPLFFVFD